MVSRRNNGQVRPYIRSSKPRFNWSDELKQLFDEAVRDLGCPRKATPKRIRELMRCSDIQLSHIKSRLQMCRIRMEEGRRSGGSNSAEETQSTRKTDSADNAEANGDEHCVVEDENEAIDAGPSFTMPNQFSPQYNKKYPLKRLRMETEFAACWSSSIRGSADAVTAEFYFDYFESAQMDWRAVTEFSCDDLFRDEQSDAFKEMSPEEGHSKENTEKDNLQLTLSLSMPDSAKKINLDLSMAVLGS